MQIDFRRFRPGAAAPARDELLVLPRDPADADRLDMACLALEKGPDGFVRGEGEVRRVVVKIEPTLDDMLAALLLEQRLAGQPLAKAWAFAHYAAAVRRGVRPAPNTVAVADSPEALFLVLRQQAGDHLTEAATALRFAQGWRKMAAVLLPALERGADPHKEVVFADRPEFAAERRFLQADRDNYLRDRHRGRRWWLRLPGTRGRVSALYLPEPSSTVFQYWAREDLDAPDGPGYRFLAVCFPRTPEGKREWTFSTNPLERLRIGSLAGELQAAELRRDPAGAASEPWYDGSRHEFTVVGAPHGGTAQSDDEVLAILTRWGRARRVWGRPRAGWVKGTVAALVLAFLGGLLVWGGRRAWPPVVAADEPPNPFGVLARSAIPERTEEPRAATATGKKSVTLGPHATAEVEYHLTGERAEGVVKFWMNFQPQLPRELEVAARLPADGKATPLPLTRDPDGGGCSAVLRGTLTPGGPATVRVAFHNPTTRTMNVDVGQVEWQPAAHEVIHLFVQAIGVGKVNVPGQKWELRDLRYPADDAVALTGAFRRQQGPLFDRVCCQEPLLDEHATADDIWLALGQLRDAVKADPAPLKLVVVTFHGHGAIYLGNYFFFYAHGARSDRRSQCVFWEGIERELSGMGCPVLVVLDACHSGQAAYQLALRGARGEVEDAEVVRAIRGFSSQQAGIALLAAAAPNQRAWELDAFKHGALTEALLEGMEGKAAGPGKVITLAELCDYANRRVQKMMSTQRQDVVPHFPPWIRATEVPVAYRGPGASP
jgi:hypothetical protein